MSRGRSIAEVIRDHAARLDFLRAVLEDENIVTSSPHQNLIWGFLQAMEGKAAIALTESLRLEASEEVAIQLYCLAGFNGSVWTKVEEIGGAVFEGYWAKVNPSWRGENR